MTTYETKTNRNFGKIAGRICFVFQMNKAREIQIFSNIGSNFVTNKLSKLTQGRFNSG